MRSSLFGRLFLLFLAVPIAELALLVWIGEHVGFWPTLGLVVATAVAGSWLAKREGLAALGRFRARLASGQLPGRELTDGLVILVAGVLLLTPGVLTDAAGLLGLLPPTRAWIRRRLEARVQHGLANGNVRLFSASTPFGTPTPGTPPRPAPPPNVDVTDATVVEESEGKGAIVRRPPGA